jgi:hypothetical protein
MRAVSQEVMNGFEKIEKIKAVPSKHLDLPEGPKFRTFSRFDIIISDQAMNRHSTTGR